MTNLEELNEMHSKLHSNLEKALEATGRIGDANLLNAIMTTYLPSIAKSLAIIADKMSEEKKED